MIETEQNAARPEPEPYVGPRPFRAEDEARLFGRDEETADLVARIEANAMVVIYAQSGAGKTSLLNAKILPALARRPCEIIGPLRFSGDVPASVLRSSDNIFVYKALLSRSLIKAGGFFRFGNVTLTKYLESLKKPELQGAIRMLRILVFDQFEEMFTLHQDRWEDRRGFFDDLAEAIAADPRLRVVFAMREEFLGTFEAYSDEISERLKDRFRLERLRRDAALEAINGPLQSTPVRFKKGADVKLVDKLMKITPHDSRMPVEVEFAEPLQLQLVCQQLWRSLPEGTTEIDETTVKAAGDVDEALYRYYESVLETVISSTGVREGMLRMWFERQLITEDGKRSIAYRGKEKTNGLPNAVVDALEREYIIRSEVRGESGPEGSAVWYELSHDRFVNPILASNAEWRAKYDRDNRATDLEGWASEWKRQDKPKDLLLTAVELRDAREWIETQEAEDIGISDLAREYVRVSGEVQGAILTERLRLQIAVAVLLGVAALGILAYVMRGKRAAERARTEAQLEVAGTLAAEGELIDSLAWALKGAASGNLPDESAQTLRRSLATLGGADWIEGPNAPIEAVDLSKDGSKLLTRSSDEICIWNLSRGKLSYCKSPPYKSWDAALLSPGGTWVAALARSTDENRGFPRASRWVVWKTVSGQKDSYLESLWAQGSIWPRESPWVLVRPQSSNISDDDRILMTYDRDRDTVTRHDLNAQREICRVDREGGSVFVGQSEQPFVIARLNSFSIWSPQCHLIHRFTEVPLSGRLHVDDRWTVLASATWDDSRLLVIDIPQRRVVLQISSPPWPRIASPIRPRVSPDGSRVAYISETINVIDVRSGGVQSRRKPSGRQTSMVENVFAAAETTRSFTRVEITDLFSAKTIQRTVAVGSTQAIAVSADMRRLVILAGGVARSYDLSVSKEYAKMSLPQLKAEACHALRNQPERKQVSGICQ